MTVHRDARMPTRRAAVAGGLRDKADFIIGVDGKQYTQAVEDEINRLAHLVFNTDNGQKLLGYLRNTTLNAPRNESVSDTELRHLEGQRWIVAVLINRAKAGAKE